MRVPSSCGASPSCTPTTYASTASVQNGTRGKVVESFKSHGDAEHGHVQDGRCLYPTCRAMEMRDFAQHCFPAVFPYTRQVEAGLSGAGWEKLGGVPIQGEHYLVCVRVLPNPQGLQGIHEPPAFMVA